MSNQNVEIPYITEKTHVGFFQELPDSPFGGTMWIVEKGGEAAEELYTNPKIEGTFVPLSDVPAIEDQMEILAFFKGPATGQEPTS